MCQDNQVGLYRPDHPLVTETLRDCLYEAMDLEGLQEILGKIGRRNAPSPSIRRRFTDGSRNSQRQPVCLFGRAWRKRRARAVMRRVDRRMDGELGRLDPAAIGYAIKLGPTCATRMSS